MGAGHGGHGARLLRARPDYHLRRPYSTLSADTAATVYTHAGLSSGQIYYYTVEATTLAGTGPASAPIGATAASALITETALNSVRLAQAVGSDQSSVATLTIPASVSGHSYRVQYTTDLLAPWTDIGTTQMGTGADLLLALPVMPPSPRAFYRVVITR